MPAAKTCDTNCVLLPACREAFLLTTQFWFKTDDLENIPILLYACVQIIITSLLPYPPKMALKVPGSPSDKVSSGWLALQIFFLQANKTSFTFPSISAEGAR